MQKINSKPQILNIESIDNIEVAHELGKLHNIEMPIVQILADMQWEGMYIDEKELVKYVLMKLERKKNTHSIPIATSIEHIYPETPQTMTLANSNLIKNIGNLVLLEDDVNSKIGNKEYDDKKTYVLNNSQMITAKQLFNKYKSWTDIEIQQRRDELIEEMYDKMWLK